MKRLFDLENPFFAPLWIRIALVLVTTVWGVLEMLAGEILWGGVFLGMSALCAWRFATINYNFKSDD